jgi:hypothetical protein
VSLTHVFLMKQRIARHYKAMLEACDQWDMPAAIAARDRMDADLDALLTLIRPVARREKTA